MTNWKIASGRKNLLAKTNNKVIQKNKTGTVTTHAAVEHDRHKGNDMGMDGHNLLLASSKER